MTSKRDLSATLVRWLAWLSLLVAFVLGQIAAKPDHQALLAQYMPGLELAQADFFNPEPIVYFITDGAAGESEALLLGEGEGYGGPMVVAIKSTRSGDGGARVDEVKLLSNKETPPYIERLQRSGFFRQFVGRSVTDDFLLDVDIDGYSGATVSARGIAASVRQTLHTGAVNHLKLTPTWQPDRWRLGIKEASMLALVTLVLVMTFARNRIARLLKLIVPLAALVLVGFYTNSSVSLGSLSAVLMGYIPSPQQHPLWWIMMATVFGGILLLGRNLYCNKLCPFSAVQDLLHKLSGISLKLDPRLLRHARRLIFTLIWASLMLIFLSRHPALGSYEPFSMMFSLEGMGMQWYILPFSILGSLFVPHFWCRLFCPVGLSLNELVRARRKAVERMTSGLAKLSGADRNQRRHAVKVQDPGTARRKLRRREHP